MNIKFLFFSKVSIFSSLLLLTLLLNGCGSSEENASDANQEAEKIEYNTYGSILRTSPDFDNIIPPQTRIEILADGFVWSEGPLWIKKEGYLVFSDVPANKMMRWKEVKGTYLHLFPSGYSGKEKRSGGLGSNGLLLNSKGNIVMCQHGDRRIVELIDYTNPIKFKLKTIADKWEGKRFNSPNDAAYHSNGDLYFTDPPYGLEGGEDDPAKEIPFQGVYRVKKNGEVDLLTDELSRPNGIAFSPDEKTLYVANSDPEKAIWMAYPVKDDGTIDEGKIFYDATEYVGEDFKGLPDGMKVRADGIIFATGPGGVWVFDSEGEQLGRISTNMPTSNCAFGNDGKALYMTVDDFLMRVWLK